MALRGHVCLRACDMWPWTFVMLDMGRQESGTRYVPVKSRTWDRVDHHTSHGLHVRIIMTDTNCAVTARLSLFPY